MAITDWPEGERPRERLLAHGPAVLSDAERAFVRDHLAANDEEIAKIVGRRR